ncbi:hypothetical protein CCAX7_56430 [Capsulimonas corticalis]|uniref:Uncharacterized protein n=2 Tax=Capsulimonas corticalis TaxID=2219043 RepID=A0A402D0J1_9BACT|nr:hypothetical protein CCAX7_56430 [Capsulimonas corticalis]
MSKGWRAITVNDQKYLWIARLMDPWIFCPHPYAPTERTGDVLIRIPDNASQTLTIKVDDEILQTPEHNGSVTPRMIRRFILGALARGWDPMQSSEAIDLQETKILLKRTDD